ncbi:MAG: aspartate/glutamate racemase family protein [Rhodoferax sp.]|uniref:aspartate/glutamate racemase family protein n=1 Tax=Rhodoferax sp. TaxID=50421 RepID=UPI0027347428|nr:aspartate/glutamate racemase family protein [Rhodoferax sp.]MDP2679745.1 aspartate/glutamate racemase family protein [Rhodoferax sp.]
MRKLLLINPNTSEAVSALLQHQAQLAAGPGAVVHTVTARFGAPYIACEASYAVAGHAVLDAWATSLTAQPVSFDAVLIGCFGDPGLMALRECSGVPVTGLAEAAFFEAARTGRFAILTGGLRWQPILERLADNLGFGAKLAGIHTVTQSGAELARDPAAAQALLQKACLACAERFGIDSIILGGAGLAGMARKIQPGVPLPVIDSVEAGVRHALNLPPVTARTSPKFDFAWHKLSPELTTLGVSSCV